MSKSPAYFRIIVTIQSRKPCTMDNQLEIYKAVLQELTEKPVKEAILL